MKLQIVTCALAMLSTLSFACSSASSSADVIPLPDNDAGAPTEVPVDASTASDAGLPLCGGNDVTFTTDVSDAGLCGHGPDGDASACASFGCGATLASDVILTPDPSSSSICASRTHYPQGSCSIIPDGTCMGQMTCLSTDTYDSCLVPVVSYFNVAGSTISGGLTDDVLSNGYWIGCLYSYTATINTK